MVPLSPFNVPTKFRSSNWNRFGEKCENVLFAIKNGHYFAESWAIRPKFCNIGIAAKLRALGPGQRFENTFWILLLRRRLQSNQTHIGPTLPVGPNKLGKLLHQYKLKYTCTCPCFSVSAVNLILWIPFNILANRKVWVIKAGILLHMYKCATLTYFSQSNCVLWYTPLLLVLSCSLTFGKFSHKSRHKMHISFTCLLRLAFQVE